MDDKILAKKLGGLEKKIRSVILKNQSMSCTFCEANHPTRLAKSICQLILKEKANA
jgi:hypothetical protein